MISFTYHHSTWETTMSMYDPLRDYLAGQPGDSCTLTFGDVEEIIRCSLPSGARRANNYKSWWANDKTHVQAASWMRAGWRTAGSPDLEAERIRFTRNPRRSPPPRNAADGPSQVIVRNLDAEIVAELKRRAKRNGRSLERELRLILTRAARPDRRALIAETDRIRVMTDGPLEDSVSLLRQDRDTR